MKYRNTAALSIVCVLCGPLAAQAQNSQDNRLFIPRVSDSKDVHRLAHGLHDNRGGKLGSSHDARVNSGTSQNIHVNAGGTAVLSRKALLKANAHVHRNMSSGGSTSRENGSSRQNGRSASGSSSSSNSLSQGMGRSGGFAARSGGFSASSASGYSTRGGLSVMPPSISSGSGALSSIRHSLSSSLNRPLSAGSGTVRATGNSFGSSLLDRRFGTKQRRHNGFSASNSYSFQSGASGDEKRMKPFGFLKAIIHAGSHSSGDSGKTNPLLAFITGKGAGSASLTTAKLSGMSSPYGGGGNSRYGGSSSAGSHGRNGMSRATGRRKSPF